MPKATKIFLMAVALALLAGAGAALWMQSTAPLQISSGTLFVKPKRLAAFSLQNANGKAFTNLELMGHWSLIFAGYTHCPDVCPTTLATLAATVKAMGLAGNRLSVVFLSVDPQRDTPARLQSYVHYFDPDFTAVTGDDKTLQALGEQLGYVYEKVPYTGSDTGSEDYEMDHSAALMLIDPAGRLDGYLLPPFDIHKLTSDLTRIVHSRTMPRV